MAQQTAEELVVAGFGDVYVAPYGTALPPNTDERAALNAAYTKLGFVTEDGLTFSWAPTVEDYMAWQSRSAVRRELTTQEFTFTYALEQWNDDNMRLAFGGGEVSEVAPGVFRYDFLNDDDALEELTMVLDWNDGDNAFRLVVPRGNVTDTTEVQLQRGALATLPISFKALAPGAGASTAYMLTNAIAFSEHS